MGRAHASRRAFVAGLVWALAHAAAAGPRAFPGMTESGHTGLNLVPTGQVIPHHGYAIGLHRGVLKASYGLLGVLEAGVTLPDLFDDRYFSGFRHWREATTGFVKLGGEPFPDTGWLPGIAAGGDNSLERTEDTVYGTATWNWRLFTWPVEMTLGAGSGRFDDRMFWGAGVIPRRFFGNALKFIGEFSGRQAGLGARFALSRDMRLDFYLLMDAERVERDGDRAWTLSLQRGILGASKLARADWPGLFRRIFGPRPGKKSRR